MTKTSGPSLGGEGVQDVEAWQVPDKSRGVLERSTSDDSLYDKQADWLLGAILGARCLCVCVHTRGRVLVHACARVPMLCRGCVCVCVCGRVRVGVCVYAQGPLSVLPVDIAFWKCVCAHVHTLHHACMHETACHACMCFHVYGQRLRQTPESASACAAYVTLAYQAAARHLWLPARVRLTQRTFCCPDILFFSYFLVRACARSGALSPGTRVSPPSAVQHAEAADTHEAIKAGAELFEAAAKSFRGQREALSHSNMMEGGGAGQEREEEREEKMEAESPFHSSPSPPM